MRAAAYLLGLGCVVQIIAAAAPPLTAGAAALLSSALKVEARLVMKFAGVLGTKAVPVCGAVVQLLMAVSEEYNRIHVDGGDIARGGGGGDGDVFYDSDGDEHCVEALATECIGFMGCMSAAGGAAGAMLLENITPALGIVLSYMRESASGVEQWAEDPSACVRGGGNADTPLSSACTRVHGVPHAASIALSAHTHTRSTRTRTHSRMRAHAQVCDGGGRAQLRLWRAQGVPGRALRGGGGIRGARPARDRGRGGGAAGGVAGGGLARPRGVLPVCLRRYCAAAASDVR